jgi:hypothetical protein
MINLQDLIRSASNGNPKDPMLASAIAKQLRERGFKQRTINGRRYWLSPEDQEDTRMKKASEILKSI